MIEIRTLIGKKKVCIIDENNKFIEIVHKGEKVIIRVNEKGEFEIIHG